MDYSCHDYAAEDFGNLAVRIVGSVDQTEDSADQTANSVDQMEVAVDQTADSVQTAEHDFDQTASFDRTADSADQIEDSDQMEVAVDQTDHKEAGSVDSVQTVDCADRTDLAE